MRYIFVLVLFLSGCQAAAPLPLACQAARCLPDEHFDSHDCRCVLNDDATQEK